jgi:hypothetical protein
MSRIMEWILLIQICSIIEKSCGEMMQFPKPIKTFYDCQRIAYDVGAEWLGKMEKDNVNKHRLAIKVECVLPKPIDKAPESKPRVHHLHETPRHVLIFYGNQDPSEARYPAKTPSDRLKNR